MKILEHSFVISNDFARLKKFYRSFKNCNLQLPVWFRSTGTLSLTHYDLIQYAKKHNLSHITIFEDTAIPCIDAFDRLNDIQNYLDKHNDVGIITLGYDSIGWHGTLLENEVSKVFYTNTGTFSGSFAMFILNSAFDDRLKSLTTPSSSLGYDYMRSSGMTMNYSDRYSQDLFSTPILAVKDKIFCSSSTNEEFTDTKFSYMYASHIDAGDLMKNSYVISIDDKRLSIFNKTFTKSLLLPLPNKISGFNFTNSTTSFYKTKISGNEHILKIASCSASHLFIVRLAKILDLPYVCIFEDDAYPCKNIRKKLQYYLDHRPVDCNALVLGNFWIKGRSYDNDFILISTDNADDFSGAHAYVVFKQGYGLYLDIALNKDFTSDHILPLMTKTYSPAYNLFIQYSNDKSMTISEIGYLWSGRSTDLILQEFPAIESYELKIK